MLCTTTHSRLIYIISYRISFLTAIRSLLHWNDCNKLFHVEQYSSNKIPWYTFSAEYEFFQHKFYLYTLLICAKALPRYVIF